MPKNPTDASPFLSRFGGNYISGGQYLAETMCSRIAKHQGKSLCHRFWSSEPWERTFLLQLRHANSLLKIYSIDEIRGALNSPEGKRIYSLGAKFLDPLISKERHRIQTQAALPKPEPKIRPAEAPSQVEPPRPIFSMNSSPLKKLRDLDG